MSKPFTILVVCLGNVCRSPLAERLLQDRFAATIREPDEVVVSSAGVRAVVGAPMDALAAAELQRLGGDPAGHVARQLDARLVEQADLVLTATRQLRSRLLEDAPRALKRTFTIPELAALVSAQDFDGRPLHSPTEVVRRAASWRGSVHPEEYDVADPIGRSAQVHHEVAEQLDRDCATIARALSGALLGGATRL